MEGDFDPKKYDGIMQVSIALNLCLKYPISYTCHIILYILYQNVFNDNFILYLTIVIYYFYQNVQYLTLVIYYFYQNVFDDNYYQDELDDDKPSFNDDGLELGDDGKVIVGI